MRNWAAAALVVVLMAACSDRDVSVDEATRTTTTATTTTTTTAAPGMTGSCEDLLRDASQTNDALVYGPLLDESLSRCGTVDRWLAALRAHPYALGLGSPESVDPREALMSVCFADVADTQVCRQAIASGLIEAPAAR